MANPALNGVIILVLIVGIVYVFRQVWMLNIEVGWLDTFRSQRPGLSVTSPPKLLAALATMLGGDKQRRISLSSAGETFGFASDRSAASSFKIAVVVSTAEPRLNARWPESVS